MLDPNYKWKRFWCPRSGRINLADGGYLYDPEAEWGKIYNPDLVTFEVISNLPCLVMLGEPGIGKSRTLESEQDKIINKIEAAGDQVLLLNLRSYKTQDSLVEELFKSLEFTNWLKGSHQLYIFLDSLDECLLRIDTVAALLADKFNRREIRSKAECLYLRIACRTAVWQAVLEEGLKQLWGKDNVGIYELAPLRRVDVREAAKIEGIDNPGVFLEEINKKNVVPLAIKPITLEFLIKTYRYSGGKFSPNQRLYELYLEGCLWLCEERNKSRISSKLKGNFQRQQRLIIAARIAAITIFSNRFAIRTGIQGDVQDDDVLIEKICQGTESVDGREFEITEEAVEEVLDTALFSSRGELSRMGWAHQTYAEFLAAWYLVQHETHLDKVMSLIVSPGDSERKLIPQLHETAAWLASMRTDILQEIMKTDPDVLLRSDIPTDTDIRVAIVDNLLKQYEQGRLFDTSIDNYSRYQKLKHSRLAVQLRPYIQDSSKPIDVRDAAIDIAEVCEVDELQEDLVNLALDSSQSIYLRSGAAKAICTVGDKNTKLRLKPLAFGQLPEDEDDQLKGYVFRALWSDNLTAEELFNSITPLKKRNFGGAYLGFLNSELVPKLQPTDLVVALKWLETQDLIYYEHPFERLANVLLLKAWEYFDLPDIIENFTKIAFIQWREDRRIISQDNELIRQFELSLINDIQKRHKLIEKSVIMGAKSPKYPEFLISNLTEHIIQDEDVLWMLGKLQNIDSQEERIWSQLIQWKFNKQDVNQVNQILTATQTNHILRENFAFYLSTIDLDSTEAEKLRSECQRRQEQRNRRQNPLLVDPPPKEQVLLFLDQLESGNLSAWWQLNRAMALKPDSQFYEKDLESNLTALPGWLEADTITRKRIIDGAKKYIQKYNQVADDWIGTNTYNLSELAGCRALQLLLQEIPEFLDTLSPELWRRWASVIVGFPHNNQREHYYTKLVEQAYINAPSETLNTLVFIIDKKNEEQHSEIFIFDKFERCWDERFKATLLKKAKNTVIKSKCMGQLLEELLKHESTEAREFAQTLLTCPRTSEEAYQKAVVTAKILVEYAEPNSWIVVWSVIRQDTDFGREVFEEVANRHPRGIYLNLTEQQLAELYIWLVQQYPYIEDPDDDIEVLTHDLVIRENITSLRDGIREQLRDTGTSQACVEIERIIEQFPKLKWLKKTLLIAQDVMRRKSWQPLQPEQILQIVTNQSDNKSKHTEIKTLNVTNNRTINIGGGNYNERIEGNYVQGNYYTAQIQSLAEAAAEIQTLLEQLDKSHPTDTTAGKKAIATQAIEYIDSNHILAQRVLSALKAGGVQALAQFLNHPAASFVIGALDDWQKTKIS